MKIAIVTLLLAAGIAGAYCEYGTKVDQDYVPGGHLVTYDFGQGRRLSFKFYTGQSIPYSIRYDFYKYEVCQY